eukprot:7076976-Pyramimonas_sp.AAC.2
MHKNQARSSVASELGLLLELGLRNYSYRSSHLERCCLFSHVTRAVGDPFSVLNSGCRRATELVRTDTGPEALGAFVCCIERSGLGLLPELGSQNYLYSTDTFFQMMVNFFTELFGRHHEARSI